MSEILKAHLDKFITISDEEFAGVISFFSTRVLNKKENLLTEGQICKSNYFVLSGILRKFFIDNKGVEHTIEFAIENWWMTDNFSFLNNSETEFYIQSVKKSEVLLISHDKQKELLEKHPVMEKYFRCIHQRALAAIQMRIKFLQDMSREELYHHFRKTQPQFLQRVPQYLIASYLGITPEYLSEIRKKSIS